MRALMKSLSLCLTALMLMAWPNPSVKGEETVVLRDEDLTITYDPSSAFQVDLSAESGDFIITQAGTYVLTGSLTGQLAIQTDAKALVRLVLNNATIFNPKGVAVYGMSGDKIILTLAEGSSNAITDGTDYARDEEGADAAVYTKTDLTINGTGSLAVKGQTAHGVVTKDSLLVTGGAITVTAVKSGMRAKDSLVIVGGSLKVNAGSDGLAATGADAGKGWVHISDGNFAIRAQRDGIHAESRLTVMGGSFDIITGSGSAAALEFRDTEALLWQWGRREQRDNIGSDRRRGRSAWSDESAASALPDSSPEGSGGSMKGIKAKEMIAIYGGSFCLDTVDDALHSNGDLVIASGDFLLSSGDDAMHADGNLWIKDGNITIKDCYEGLEGKTVTIDGGILSIYARDDGINATDPSIGTTGFGDSRIQEGVYVQINGGQVTVTGGNDAIDSNGTLVITGGEVNLTSLAAYGGNTAIDTNAGYTHLGGSVTTNDGSEAGRTRQGRPGERPARDGAGHTEPDDNPLQGSPRRHGPGDNPPTGFPEELNPEGERK